MPSFLRASVFCLVAVTLIAGVLIPSAVSTVDSGRVEALWKDYVVAKKRLQFDLARLMTDQWPDLQTVTGLQRDQQFAMLELRSMKFKYLLIFDPDRIVFNDGLDGLAEFDWTEEDSEALREQNPTYAKLESWAVMNSKRLSEHPKLSVAGERFITFQQSEVYQVMMQSYRQRMDDLESALVSIDDAKKRSASGQKDTSN